MAVAMDLRHLLSQLSLTGTTLLLLNYKIRQGADLQDVLQPVEETLLECVEEESGADVDALFFPLIATLPTAEYGQRLGARFQGRGKTWFVASNNMEDKTRLYSYIRDTRADSTKTVFAVVDVVRDRHLLEALLSWRVASGRRVVIVGLVYEDEAGGGDDEPLFFLEMEEEQMRKKAPLAPEGEAYGYVFFWPRALTGKGLRIGAFTPGKRVKLVDRCAVSDARESDLELMKRFVQDISNSATVY